MGQQNVNYGRDQNIYNQPQGIYNNTFVNIVVPELPSIESQEIPPFRKVINYIGGLFFLVIVLCWWLLISPFVKCKFPFKRIFALILASLRLMPSQNGAGSSLSMLWHEIKQQCEEKLGLTRQDFEVSDISQREYTRFNEEASEIWLLRNLIKILTAGSINKNQQIDQVLEILQKQEDSISLNLRQLRKKLDPTIESLREVLTKLNHSPLEIDSQKVTRVLNSLIRKFALYSNPTREQAESLIEELKQIISENPYGVDESGLEALQNVLQLLNWLAATGYNQPFEYEFKAEVNSARRERAIEVIVDQIEELLKRTIKDISDEAMESVEKGIRNQWLSEIAIYGFNYMNLAVVELALEVDWKKFNAWRSQSIYEGTVKIKWGRKVATEIDSTIERFNKFLQIANLTSEYRVEVSPGFTEEEAEEICRILGMNTSPVYWNEQGIKAEEEETTIQDLAELGVGLYFKPRKHKEYS
jgi:hypothetical protein